MTTAPASETPVDQGSIEVERNGDARADEEWDACRDEFLRDGCHVAVWQVQLARTMSRTRVTSRVDSFM